MVTRILLLGILEVRVHDATGKRLQLAKVEILGDTPINPNRVLHGANEIRVSESGFNSVWRGVTIAQKETVMRVVLEVGEECGTKKGAIAGQIRGIRRGEELWVKAIPVRGRGGEEAIVSASGKFLIPGLAPGDYAVLVLRGDEVIQSRTQHVGPSSDEGQKLILDLKTAQK